MSISEKPLAFSDFKITGLNPVVHEILEIGLIVVDQKTLKITDHLSEKVRPEHTENATLDALSEVCYNEFDWQGACSIEDAMRHYAEKTKGAILFTHSTVHESFLRMAFHKTGVKNEMDPRRIDFWTVAWMKLRRTDLSEFSLDEVSRYFDLQKEPRPHRALQGALNLFEIYKRLAAQ